MNSHIQRRTHKDPTTIRTFEDTDSYWHEATLRRRYSIPHSDGSFFSDGSGYSNGLVADLRYEIIERLRETALRLEQIDLATLESIREDETNADFIPYARETEEDIRLTRAAMLQIDDADVSVDILENWQNTFAHLASKYIGRAAGICGIFLENVATEAGKELGKTIGKAGGVALTLYLVGVDFHGIAAALVQLIQKLSGV